MKICRNCHFLAKGSGESKWPVTSEERLELKNPHQSLAAGFSSWICYHGVWDEGVGKIDLNRELNEKDREGFCFFFPYHEGMLFPAAKVLQEREAENGQLKMSNFYTRIGLYISAGALVANALVTYFKK